MKRMYFHNINGKTTAVVRNNELITKDGSAIHIKYNVVLQALQMGIFKDRKFAMRSNIYYKVDDRTTMLIDKLKQWQYYYKKLPLYMRNSYGIQDHFKMILDYFLKCMILSKKLLVMVNIVISSYSYLLDM